MRLKTGMLAALAAVLTLALAGTAQAVNFNPAASAYTANTTTLSLTGPGANVTGKVEGGTAVFSFGEVNIPAGATLTITGTRPFKMVAAGAMNVAGEINGSGASAFNLVPGPNAGGPGGGAGGKDDAEAGQGPGAGGIGSSSSNGGGGGGFGGFGVAGGVDSTGTGGKGGIAYSDIVAVLEGGSGGGGSSIGINAAGGGGGGGAVALLADSLAISPSGVVAANGGGGAVGNLGASGGGSGGGIFLRASRLELGGKLEAVGGEGGAGGCCGDGGGGGGGEIALQYQSLVSNEQLDVSGGTSGTRSTAAPFSHGGLSPEPEGEEGFVVEQPSASATSLPATAVTTSGATMNGSVNPHGNATTYRFEYGTSNSYGTTLSSGGGDAGRGEKGVSVSQALTGLTPNTTYHYRVVTSDALGFTSTGSDVSFTTAAPAVAVAPVPKPKAPKTKLTKATIDKEGGTATFKFKATGTTTGFKCSLAKKGKKAKKGKFKKCKSPKTYKGLKAGKYTFQVKAVNGSAADATPAKKKFKID